MEIFTLHWRGPMASQAGSRIDGFGQSQAIPSRSAIAGLLGAALGISVGSRELVELADAFNYAVEIRKPGAPITDYQTADLTKMKSDTMWWFNDGRVGVVKREGSKGALTTRVQNRPLLCDVDMVVYICLQDNVRWSAEELIEALLTPKFPLSLGRENCPPSGRIAGAKLDCTSLEEALSEVKGLVYQPLIGGKDSMQGWGDIVVSIPSRGRPDDRFTVQNRV